MRKVTTLACHHSATATGSVEAFDREHRKLGFAKIGYHAVIGNGRGMPDGVIGIGRLDEEAGAAVFGANAGKLHACLVGNFHKPEAGYTGPPSRAQLDALGWWLLSCNWGYAGRFARPPLEVVGHNEVALKTHPTACPGSEFPMAAVRRWFDHYALTWRPGDMPSVSLGAFVERGGALALLDDVVRMTETPKRLRVFVEGHKPQEVPRDDWEIRQGQTWVRLRPFCTALGAEVAGTPEGPVVRWKP